MKSNLIKTYNSGPSDPAWHTWRFQNGIGASDVACICGLTASWRSPIELFYGLLDFNSNREESIRMALGNDLETIICKWYTYWDGTVMGMLNNRRNGIIINEISKVNAFIQNPNYPWLFCSLDSRIHKNGEKGEGVLEAKSISGNIAKKYIDSLPPYQLIQVQTQLLITELEYGDLAIMTDANDFGVYSFKPNAEIFEHIITKTKDFWARVKKARIIATRKFEAVKAFNMRLANDLDAELVSLEPALIGGEAEALFLKEKYKKPMAEVGIIPGTEADFQLAKELLAFKEQIKALEADVSIRQNSLIRRIGDNNALNFGKRGQVSYKGSPRRFNNGIKI